MFALKPVIPTSHANRGRDLECSGVKRCYGIIDAQYFALINIKLKLWFFAKASFSFLNILLEADWGAPYHQSPHSQPRATRGFEEATGVFLTESSDKKFINKNNSDNLCWWIEFLNPSFKRLWFSGLCSIIKYCENWKIHRLLIF